MKSLCCAERHREATLGSLADTLAGENVAEASGEDAGGRFVDEGRPRVHSGFLRSLVDSALYQGVYDALTSLREELGGIGRMYVTGHSLGGAMAALSAPMLLRDFAPSEINLITFGCPRTGNQVRWGTLLHWNRHIGPV